MIVKALYLSCTLTFHDITSICNLSGLGVRENIETQENYTIIDP